MQTRAAAESERRKRAQARQSNPPPPIWEPQPGPQTAALESQADIIGYGGQAGGGKTDFGIGVSVCQHFRAIIYRRFYSDLKDIVRRAKEITDGHRAGFNGSDFTLTLAGGQTLEFGAMKDPDDWQRFKGRPKDLMVFDEVTEFLRGQVLSVIAWVRTTRKGQRTRVIFTFNPPTSVNGEWVLDFFAPWLDPKHPNPAHDGELRWYAMVDGVETARDNGEAFIHTRPGGEVETITPQSRTFIRARLADNKFLDEDGEYRRRLQNTPEPLRSQLLYGAFDLSRPVNPWQVIPTAWAQAAIQRGKTRTVPPVLLTSLGVDVAHGGIDQTVIAPRFGDWIGALKKVKGADTPDGKSAAREVLPVFQAAYHTSAYINVDAIGYGASCAEKLADKAIDGGYGLRAHPINVGGAPTGKAHGKPYTDKSGMYQMRNLRAEMYWRLREALDPDNDATLCLPDDPELLADICAPTYAVTPSGIQVEDKDDIKKRLDGRSPDCGDAVALSMLPEPEPDISGLIVSNYRQPVPSPKRRTQEDNY